MCENGAVCDKRDQGARIRDNVSMRGTFLLKLLKIGKSYINKLDFKPIGKEKLSVR